MTFSKHDPAPSGPAKVASVACVHGVAANEFCKICVFWEILAVDTLARTITVAAQFLDERCAACGHDMGSHHNGGYPRGRCFDCPAERRCQRFVQRAGQ